MSLGSLPGNFDSVRESSIAAIESALNITRDITSMDDILNVRRMPLAAVLLLQKAGSVAVWLQIHFNHINEVLKPLTESLERASNRWMIASQLAPPFQNAHKLTFSERISSELCTAGGIVRSTSSPT